MSFATAIDEFRAAAIAAADAANTPEELDAAERGFLKGKSSRHGELRTSRAVPLP